ncbi:MAG TPA: AzlD domain-containing protein [Acidimicrobiia bacterium]
MTDLFLVLGVAAITYGSRVALMTTRWTVPGGWIGRFLDVFPLALFIAIATSGLLAPDGTPAVTPGLAAAAGGVLGAVLFKRSLVGVLAIGAAAFYLTRYLVG